MSRRKKNVLVSVPKTLIAKGRRTTFHKRKIHSTNKKIIPTNIEVKDMDSFWLKLKPHKRHIRKVQLGAGRNCSDDWINIDYYDADHVDLNHDLKKPLPFPDNSIEEFYSHHVLEHFNLPDLTNLLKEIHRCLKPGGIFNSRLPDIEAAMRQMLNLLPVNDSNKERWKHMMLCIYGGNAFGWTPPDAHKHYFGWTRDTMYSQLVSCGFEVIRCESNHSDEHIPCIDFKVSKS